MVPVSAELLLHPSSACSAIRGFRAAIESGPSREEIRISFRIDGAIGQLRLPERGSALRLDGLWQHSCFEAFVKSDAGDSYHEFNFAPSGDWAAYRFASRREGRQSPALPAPERAFRRAADFFEMNAVIALGGIADFAVAEVLHAGLAAVIEDQDGGLSYWALAHRAAQPDFHDPDTFELQVTR